VKFTTRGQTRTRRGGKVTWINHQVKQAPATPPLTPGRD
jgi:hypothetical protein